MKALLLMMALLGAMPAAAQKRSGYQDASPPVRAMQDDDGANPGFLWVQQGISLWNEAAGKKSCASCHGGIEAMRGVAARYPAFDTRTKRPITLAQRVNRCRIEQQSRPALATESDEMLALTAAIGVQSRGLPLAVEGAGPLQPFAAAGERLFHTRQGQLNLSCAQCHDERAGMKLGGATIPQGHPNGYPLYRLEWQGMGSLPRRLRACLIGVRAEPYAPDAEEEVAIEVYLAVRAQGLAVETPAVRP